MLTTGASDRCSDSTADAVIFVIFFATILYCLNLWFMTSDITFSNNSITGWKGLQEDSRLRVSILTCKDTKTILMKWKNECILVYFYQL